MATPQRVWFPILQRASSCPLPTPAVCLFLLGADPRVGPFWAPRRDLHHPVSPHVASQTGVAHEEKKAHSSSSPVHRRPWLQIAPASTKITMPNSSLQYPPATKFRVCWINPTQPKNPKEKKKKQKQQKQQLLQTKAIQRKDT